MPYNVTPVYDPDTMEYLGWIKRLWKEDSSESLRQNKVLRDKYAASRRVDSILGRYTSLPTLESNYFISNNYTTNVTWKLTASTVADTAQYLTAYNEAVSRINIQLTTNLSDYIWRSVTTETYKPAVLTPEQLLAAKRKATIAKAKATRAKNKARTLLLMYLDIRQTLDFETHGFFYVEGSEGNLYQIRQGRSHNVRLIDPSTMKAMFTLCAHPIEAVPDCDTMLAQKLWIENDEPAFVKMANRGLPIRREEEQTARLVIGTLPQIQTRPYHPALNLAV